MSDSLEIYETRRAWEEGSPLAVSVRNNAKHFFTFEGNMIELAGEVSMLWSLTPISWVAGVSPPVLVISFSADRCAFAWVPSKLTARNADAKGAAFPARS